MPETKDGFTIDDSVLDMTPEELLAYLEKQEAQDQATKSKPE